MRSQDIWNATVRVFSGTTSGTGLLVASDSANFDYVLTALHNLDSSNLLSVNIEAMNGDQLTVLDVSCSSDSTHDIAILHVKKYQHSQRIAVCNEEINYAEACAVGYPGALFGKQRKAVDYKGNITFNGSAHNLHFNIEAFPDPDVDKHDYITGFSGSGVFELSECRQFAKLKGIIIERWEAKFDVKKLECIRIAVVAQLLDKLGLPSIARIVESFSSFLESPPQSLHNGIVEFVNGSRYVEQITGLDTESVLKTITINMPPGGDFASTLRSRPNKTQTRFFEDIFSVKSISFAYYVDSLPYIDLNSNPLSFESNLSIVICCVTDDTKAPQIVCRLVTQEYKDYLKNAIVVVCHLAEPNEAPKFINYSANLTASVIENYTSTDTYLDRSAKKDVRNYLEFDREQKRFSVYSIASLCYEVNKCLEELYYKDKEGFLDDVVFARTIREKLDETVKI